MFSLLPIDLFLPSPDTFLTNAAHAAQPAKILQISFLSSANRKCRSCCRKCHISSYSLALHERARISMNAKRIAMQITQRRSLFDVSEKRKKIEFVSVMPCCTFSETLPKCFLDGSHTVFIPPPDVNAFALLP